MIAAWYWQLNHLADVTNNHTNGRKGQIERIKSNKSHVKRVKATFKRIMILGDINIDMSEDVDQTIIGRTGKKSWKNMD